MAPDSRVLVRGVMYIGAFRWAAQLLSWVSTLVIVRLLRPEDYGIMGMAVVFIGVAAVLSEFGLGTAIVALPRLDEREVAQLNGGALLVSGSMALLATAAAPLIASFYGEPALRLVIPVLAVGFVLEGVRTVPIAMLSRRLAYQDTAQLDFTRHTGAAVLVLFLAWAGAGYWALVAGNLGGSVITAVWVLVRHRQPIAMPRLADLGRPLAYSRHILTSRVAWQAYRNSDFLIAGRMFGADMLGFYTVAWNLASLPGEKLGNVLTAATAPFFSAIQQDRAALRRYFLQVTEALALVLLPVLMGLLLVADLAVPLVIGERWLPALPALQALIGYAAIQAVLTPVSQILNVTGNTRITMLSSGLSLLVLPPAFYLGGRLGGITGVACAWLVTYPFLTQYPLSRARRALELPFLEYLGAWRRAVEGVLGIALAVLAVRAVLPAASPSWGRLGLLVGTGAIAFIAVMWLRHRATLGQIRNLLSGRAGEPAGVVRPFLSASPAVSVIIPAWNVAEYIGEAVQSVVGQTFQDWELIVVNDGSPDTPAMERALAPYRDRITYLVQENRGAAAARNAGLLAARAPWVAFLDGDDVWLPGFLESQLDFLRRNHLDMVYADAELIGAVPRPGDTFMTRAASRGQVTPSALLLGECHVITSGTVARANLLTELGGFDPALRRAQDFDMWFRVAKAEGRIGYQAKVLLQYRMREGSLSGTQVDRVEREISVIEHVMEGQPLSRLEQRAASRMLAEVRARLELVHAKAALRAGEFREARRRIYRALRANPTAKLLAVLAAIVLAPGLLQRRLPAGK